MKADCDDVIVGFLLELLMSLESPLLSVSDFWIHFQHALTITFYSFSAGLQALVLS